MSIGTGAGANKIRILIADDHEMVLDVFAMYLSSAPDMDVTTAKTLDEALEHIQDAGPFDVVPLDLNMPGMNGVSGLRRAIRSNGGKPVAIITGNPTPRMLDEIMNAGSSGIVLKTTGVRSLANAIRFMNAGEHYMPLELVRERHNAGRTTQERPSVGQGNDGPVLSGRRQTEQGNRQRPEVGRTDDQNARHLDLQEAVGFEPHSGCHRRPRFGSDLTVWQGEFPPCLARRAAIYCKRRRFYPPLLSLCIIMIIIQRAQTHAKREFLVNIPKGSPRINLYITRGFPQTLSRGVRSRHGLHGSYCANRM